ncbi:proline dehydrogenase family protein [Fulvivirga ligni]|uniref:proline dehydrogenase family protein n=1 Tax=Fulvivirga ligni TaxID=2904246 RepID=UPI001F36DA4C|nr:proline dehydrogenase family protein [Fulvivirga ligni]UII24284.1 proline dehydrogenase family protein [Fulvivirga ligni]
MMNQDLLTLGSQALKKMALSQEAKSYIIANPQIYNVLKKATDRYIGGDNLEQTVAKVVDANHLGYKASIEYMGENAADERHANEATDEFLRILKQIDEQNLNATVSLDLSHIGLNLSTDLAEANLGRILDNAGKTEVIISAEGVEQTDHVLNTYLQFSPDFSNLSITMQAYLYRSKDDFIELKKQSGRIRLVKGAFDIPAQLGMARGEQLDEVYLDYLDQLLASHHMCSIATHHDIIQQQAIKLIEKYNAPPSTYEFESLYGICNEQLAQLKDQGYPTKLYYVYGEEWYLYLCNRLAEYPLNLFRALNDIISE